MACFWSIWGSRTWPDSDDLEMRNEWGRPTLMCQGDRYTAGIAGLSKKDNLVSSRGYWELWFESNAPGCQVWVPVLWGPSGLRTWVVPDLWRWRWLFRTMGKLARPGTELISFATNNVSFPVTLRENNVEDDEVQNSIPQRKHYMGRFGGVSRNNCTKAKTFHLCKMTQNSNC